MIDRYTRAVKDLQDADAPDQWDEITDRAADDGAVVVLDAAGGRSSRRRRVTLIAAAVASIAALLGGVWLVQDDDRSSVVADDPPATSDPERTDVLIPTPFDADPPDAGDPEPFYVACNAGSLASTTPPDGITGDVQPPGVDDPRVPPELRDQVVGVYPGDTTTRVVFSLEGHPEIGFDQSRAFTQPGPGAIGRTLFAPYDDGWVARVDVAGDDDELCLFTLVGVGINQADFVQFVQGLVVTTTPN
jgi:hypothetical protein